MAEEVDPELEALRKKKAMLLMERYTKEQEKADWPSKVVHVGDSNFNDIISGYGAVLVDFWAPWCMPCKMVGPILERLAPEYKGRAVIAKLNVDDNKRIAGSLNVQGIPTLIMYKDGKMAKRVTGAIPERGIRELLDAYS
ncbi:MAG: thioredoxin [Thermoplasmatota archaeon]